MIDLFLFHIDIDECALLMNGGMAMMTTMMMENMTTDMMTTMMETTTADMMGDNMTTTTEMPEMMMEIVPCDDKATCMNTPGGYTCQCPRAYVGNGFSCRRKYNDSNMDSKLSQQWQTQVSQVKVGLVD